MWCRGPDSRCGLSFTNAESPRGSTSRTAPLYQCGDWQASAGNGGTSWKPGNGPSAYLSSAIKTVGRRSRSTAERPPSSQVTLLTGRQCPTKDPGQRSMQLGTGYHVSWFVFAAQRIHCYQPTHSMRTALSQRVR